jgi:hypothetical protein
MTVRTRTDYRCECGATAHSILSENDQPYSRMWERTEYFGAIDVEDRPRDQWRCRACGQAGRVKIVDAGAA